MHALFEFLRANPFLLLFLTVGLAVWVGRFSVKGYGLGMVAAAVVVGVVLATWASTYGVKLQLDNFAKSSHVLPVHVRRGAAGRPKEAVGGMAGMEHAGHGK